MRFLYADSEPFPLAYDFLATLDRFVQHGGRAAHSEAQVARLRRAHLQRSKSIADTVAALEKQADETCLQLDTAKITAPNDAVVGSYMDKVAEYSRQAADELAAEQRSHLSRVQVAAEEEISGHRRTARAELETFLIEGELGGELVDAIIELREGVYAIEATRRLIGGAEVTYHIATERFEAWREPRKVSSLAGEMEIQVGMRKKFLRRDLTREMMRVGDHTIMRAVLGEDGAEIALKKKPDHPKPPITLVLGREEDGLDAYIERVQADGSELFPAIPSDTEKIVGLWEALQEVSQRALDFRDAVVRVEIGGVDIFVADTLDTVVENLLAAYAPIAREIEARSPSGRELSLKIEHPDGSREERYLEKAKLRAALADWDPTVQNRFASLPLEDTRSMSSPPEPT